VNRHYFHFDCNDDRYCQGHIERERERQFGCQLIPVCVYSVCVLGSF